MWGLAESLIVLFLSRRKKIRPMQKLQTRYLALSVIITGSIILSCSKDEPFIKPKLSIQSGTLTYKESDGDITVNIVLDKAYDKDITIEYSLGGTAIDKVKASATSSAYDYEITSDYLELEIPKGETTGTIEIRLYSDLSIENSETIEIALESVNDENIELTRDDDVEITVEQEDGMVILLEWGVGTGENYTDVDMDLFLWVEDETSTLALSNIFSSRASFQSPELIFLPSGPFPDGTYGLSCNYYEGSQDPMNFLISFYSIVDGNDNLITSINGSYTLNNLNAWDVTDVDPILVQTFEKSGSTFSNFSAVTVPPTGSRVVTSRLPEQVVRQGQSSALPGIVSKILEK